MYPDLTFFFGLAGSGKSFAGQTVAERLGNHFYELDNDLTPAMRSAIAEKRTFTDEMRDEYFEVVCKRLSELKALHPKLVVSQAAYKNRHRKMIRNAHPNVELIWVRAPREVLIDRLTQRGDQVTPAYAEEIERNFEEPLEGKELHNTAQGSDALFEQFQKLFL